MSDAPTFRDFATQVFGGDLAGASSTLAVLLDVAGDRARTAAEHFQGQTSDPAFLPKAMSLRTAVTTGTEEEAAALLAECFGLSPDEAQRSAATLRARHH
jgi:hypothetical protein